MKTPPRVSVIIPAYNHCDFVVQTLESVFAQTFADHEVIVVNDGSPDDTAFVLRPYVEAGRIRYIEQTNLGQAAARNRGLAEATGELIAFLDDDDLWPADNLLAQEAALDGNPSAVLAFGDVVAFPEPLEVTRALHEAPTSARETFLMLNRFVSPGQVLVRRDALEAIGGFDAEIWGCDDWDLYLRLAERGSFAYTGRLALQYRVHAQNASRDRLRMFVNAMKVFEKNQPVSPTEALFWRAGRRAVTHGVGARLAVDDCCDRILAGRYRSGFGGLITLWRHAPNLLRRRSVWKQLATTSVARASHKRNGGRAALTGAA